MAVETRVRFPVTAFGLFLGLPVLNFPKRRDWVQKGCNTQGSHVITHRSTNWACRCLTSQIGRDGVLSPEYGRIRWAYKRKGQPPGVEPGPLQGQDGEVCAMQLMTECPLIWQQQA